MADFGTAGTLPLEVARRIWLNIPYEERLMLECVHSTWQRPSMPYGNDNMQFQMYQKKLESFRPAILNFLHRNGTHLGRIALRFFEFHDDPLDLDISDLMIGITEQCVHLKTLDIRGTGLIMNYVSFLPRNLTSLTLSVSLPRKNLPAVMAALSESLNQFSCLRMLAVSCAPWKYHTRTPAQLDLNLSQLRVARFSEIVPNVMTLRQNSPNLVAFWWNATSSDGETVQDMLPRVTSWPQLRSLTLFECRAIIYDADLAKICSELPNLEDLALNSLAAIDFSPLCKLGKLRSFWVFHSDICYEDCQRLLAACQLTRLGIRETMVGKASFDEVAAVAMCPTLRRFCFGNDGDVYIPLATIKDAFHLTHVAYWRPRKSDLLHYLRYRVQKIRDGAVVGDVKLYVDLVRIPLLPQNLYEQARVQLCLIAFSEFYYCECSMYGEDDEMDCLEFWDK